MSPEYEHLQINQIIQNRFTRYIYVVNRVATVLEISEKSGNLGKKEES